MFENASELIIYSGHLLQLWDLNSIQQLTQDDDDNVRVEWKPSKVDPKWYVAGLKVFHPSQRCPLLFIGRRRRYYVDCAKRCTALIEKNLANFQQRISSQKSFQFFFFGGWSRRSCCGQINGDVTDAGRTNDERTREDRATQPGDWVLQLFCILVRFSCFTFCNWICICIWKRATRGQTAALFRGRRN